MCERCIDSLKNPMEKKEGGPVSKNSFRSRFIDALFARDEEMEMETNQPSENKNGEESISNIYEALHSSKTGLKDEVLIDDVRALPQERRRSLLLNIFDKIIGSNCIENTNDNFSNGTSGTEGSNIGVENKGFDYDGTELTLCFPERITEMNTVEVHSKVDRKVASKTSMNGKPFVVSAHPEPSLPPTPGPKTVRTWLKDPNLYKVIYLLVCFCISYLRDPIRPL